MITHTLAPFVSELSPEIHSITDFETVSDALISMRTILKTTSGLANYMRSEAVEDFADETVRQIDERLLDIEQALQDCRPNDLDQAKILRGLKMRIALTLRPDLMPAGAR